MALCALSMSFSMTSCDNEELMNILGELLTQYLNGQGVQRNFTGTATGMYAMVSTDGGQNFKFIDEKNQSATASMTLPVKLGNNAAQVDFPAVTVNGISFPATTVANLNATVNNGQTGINITVGDNTTANGTLVVDGVEYPIYNIFVDNFIFTTNETTGASTITAKQLQLWYGTPETRIYVVNYAYTGKTAATN